MRLFLLSFGYILAAFGFAFIAGYAKISLPLRERLAQESELRQDAFGNCSKVLVRFRIARRMLLELLQCPACLGVWIGFGFALADPLMFGAAAALGVDHLPLMERAFFLSLATCASNFILGALTGLIEVH